MSCAVGAPVVKEYVGLNESKNPRSSCRLPPHTVRHRVRGSVSVKGSGIDRSNHDYYYSYYYYYNNDYNNN